MALLYGTFKWWARCNAAGLPQGKERGNLESQQPLLKSRKKISNGCDGFAKPDAFGDPFALIAVKRVTGVHVSRSRSYSCQDRVSDKTQPKELHLHSVRAGREAERWHLTLFVRPRKVKPDKT